MQVRVSVEQRLICWFACHIETNFMWSGSEKPFTITHMSMFFFSFCVKTFLETVCISWTVPLQKWWWTAQVEILKSAVLTICFISYELLMKDHNRFPSSLTILELVIYFSVMQTTRNSSADEYFLFRKKEKVIINDFPAVFKLAIGQTGFLGRLQGRQVLHPQF